MISHRAHRWALVAPLVAAIGCAHAPIPTAESTPARTYAFSASSPRYLLKGAFSGNVTIGSDSIIVVASSAVLANRVPTSPAHSPLLNDITVQAYVAVPDGRTWRVASESAMVSVAPLGMDADTTLSVAPLRFAIPRPRVALATGWLAFQLTAHNLPGSPLYQEGKAEFHTYVCGAQYLVAAPGDSTLEVRQLVDSPLSC